MLETWSPSDVILFTVLLILFGGPVVYSWADRWLDRTRNSNTDVIVSEKKDE